MAPGTWGTNPAHGRRLLSASVDGLGIDSVKVTLEVYPQDPSWLTTYTRSEGRWRSSSLVQLKAHGYRQIRLNPLQGHVTLAHRWTCGSPVYIREAGRAAYEPILPPLGGRLSTRQTGRISGGRIFRVHLQANIALRWMPARRRSEPAPSTR